MSESEVAYWQREAADDPRYAAAWWGMNGADDAAETIGAILFLLEDRFDSLERPHGTVIEIGCGPGRLLVRLARRFPDAFFHGTDISPSMLEICEARISEWGDDNIQLWEGDQIPTPMAADFVYCVELFQHLDDRAVTDYILQAHQVLSPHGKFTAQFVTDGARGPHSFPRSADLIYSLFDRGWGAVETTFALIHRDWAWVTATKR